MIKRKKRKPHRLLTELTYLQKRFVEYYAGQGVEAARKAGYSGNSKTLGVMACNLLQKPKIQKALKERDRNARRRRIYDRESILKAFSEIARDETAPAQDRLRALENLGRAMGLYTQKVIMAAQVQQKTHHSFDRLSDDEIVERMNKTLRNCGITQRVRLSPTGVLERDPDFR